MYTCTLLGFGVCGLSEEGWSDDDGETHGRPPSTIPPPPTPTPTNSGKRRHSHLVVELDDVAPPLPIPTVIQGDVPDDGERRGRGGGGGGGGHGVGVVGVGGGGEEGVGRLFDLVGRGLAGPCKRQ